MMTGEVGRWAVVHDFAFAMGGAERVTEALCRAVPGDDLTYIAGDGDVVGEIIGKSGREPVRLAPRWWTEKNYRALTPLAHRSVSRATIQGNALVSSYAFSHWVPVTGRKVVYCHTPLRQLWSGYDYYVQHGSVPQRVAMRAFVAGLRRRDRKAAATVDQFISTSRAVRDRIDRYYRPAAPIPIIPPPLAPEFAVTGHVGNGCGEYYLWVGRLIEPYKKVGLLLECFRREKNRRLVIVGEGRDRRRLEAVATPNVEFVGWKREQELAGLYAGARAVIFPSEDDFGLVPVEAGCQGTPVIALGAGGALDTVIDGGTGVLYRESDAASLLGALRRFEASDFDRAHISDITRERFSVTRFESSILEVLHAWA